ncbi:MAG: penicillin-binding protein 2 [Bacteroidia bacterium]|nr:penicillin-binding protein 2 [Bacteroidia bacterium]
MNDLKIRGGIMLLFFGLVIFIYISRLFYLQVISKDYALKSDQKDLEEVTLLPSRGIIYDRNENIFVQNVPVFDIMFVPNKLVIPDTNLLEKHLGLDRVEIRKQIRKHKGIGRYQPQELVKQVPIEAVSRFQEDLWQFEGISVQARNTREYIYPAGAAFLGYINQVSQRDLDRDSAKYYVSGDLIGISGIERQYEPVLRGKKGTKTILVDAYNREVSRYADGALDVLPIEGKDIKMGIDAALQAFGERLMANKKGSIVAIEPETGEILAFISAPTFDPNQLTGRSLGKNYQALVSDSLQPLFSRPLMAQYPPGSIFKLLQTLAALSEGVIDPSTHFPCVGAWPRNRGKPACHGAHGSCSLPTAIKVSCNAFYAETYYTFLNHPKFGGDIHKSYQRWYEIMSSYGIGRNLGVDIPNEKPGNVPTTGFYDRSYGQNGWGALTIYSNSIGQGEILMTPMQMANAAVLIANRGKYIPPHFLTHVRNDDGQWEKWDFPPVILPGKREDYDLVVDAMEQVVQAGTGTMAKVDSIVVCGKTGTVENPPYPDHSVFIAFAPKDNPKIAIGVIVENAGFGGTWAAPIASLMIERYLRKKIKNKAKLDRILQADFIHTPLKKTTH